ncbi:hypothetical protein FA10DRAFT_300950 [Acaromyces ingoldii]|uniref:CID domain-containing protein n=1 Tax=Acaromyces ingoldii TaxID=215250 RepID=A0A316YST2_9BASI|nr:hypothetical protein FA10DRAFT_300950 [Acaromyces ingoldii]PWN92467.1 hypothetical protein FA10DRAFT_300950 [Acaromyces ingoldii]
MDPFQIRLECLSLVRRLSASQQSIQKVVDFAMRHASSAADDVWDCLVSECARAGLNAKLNILFLLDALLLSIVDPVGHAASCNAAQAQASAAYLAMALRDLRKIVDAVVPHDRSDAVRLNAGSTQKVLESWRSLQLFDSELLRGIEDELEARKNSLATEAPHKLADFSRQDIQRRMEEDRERVS